MGAVTEFNKDVITAIRQRKLPKDFEGRAIQILAPSGVSGESVSLLLRGLEDANHQEVKERLNLLEGAIDNGAGGLVAIFRAASEVGVMAPIPGWNPKNPFPGRRGVAWHIAMSVMNISIGRIFYEKALRGDDSGVSTESNGELVKSGVDPYLFNRFLRVNLSQEEVKELLKVTLQFLVEENRDSSIDFNEEELNTALGYVYNYLKSERRGFWGSDDYGVVSTQNHDAAYAVFLDVLVASVASHSEVRAGGDEVAERNERIVTFMTEFVSDVDSLCKGKGKREAWLLQQIAKAFDYATSNGSPDLITDPFEESLAGSRDLSQYRKYASEVVERFIALR